MTEIPEHLRKRAEAARQKAADKAASEAGGEPSPAEAAPAGAEAPAEADQSAASSKIPAHLLERSKAAKAKRAGGGETPAAGAVAATGGGGAPTAVATAPASTATGPQGHTQRLLTVVKAGSIQDVKSSPTDKVHVWPHLLVAEFVAALFVTLFTTVFSIFVNAPLLELANVNETPNPSKAPWYFLGLQELLTMFHPMVAGVTIPGMGIFLLILAPYMDRNPSNKPEDRKFAIGVFTVQLMFWSVLVLMGSFFRGPGFNFVAPWDVGLFFDL